MAAQIHDDFNQFRRRGILQKVFPDADRQDRQHLIQIVNNLLVLIQPEFIYDNWRFVLDRNPP